MSRSTLQPEQITSVYMGNVLSAGAGQAPARQAAIYAGLPTTTEATTVNKGSPPSGGPMPPNYSTDFISAVCSSGLKAIALAAQDIQLGLASAVVAGGMENSASYFSLFPHPLVCPIQTFPY